MKTKIEIKNRWTGKVLFKFESENNTVKYTILEAIKRGANLRGANLSDANLRGANLSGADLSGADLSGANLRDAYLSRADLRGANLSGANLRGANLSDAYLSGADLSGANLSDADLSDAYLSGADLRGIKIAKAMAFSGLYKYIAMPIIADDGKHYVKLGCHLRSVEDWDADFWNNPCEFPNDNSVKSKLRVLAYDTCKRWLEINTATV